MELNNCEDLSGTQAEREVIDPAQAVVWFATKEMARDRKLSDYLGKNEKTKVVVKLSSKGSGPPVREPRLSEEERKKLMLAEHRRREEIKRVMEEDDYSYMNSQWADRGQLSNRLQGLENLSWKPK